MEEGIPNSRAQQNLGCDTFSVMGPKFDREKLSGLLACFPRSENLASYGQDHLTGRRRSNWKVTLSVKDGCGSVGQTTVARAERIRVDLPHKKLCFTQSIVRVQMLLEMEFVNYVFVCFLFLSQGSTTSSKLTQVVKTA